MLIPYLSPNTLPYLLTNIDIARAVENGVFLCCMGEMGMLFTKEGEEMEKLLKLGVVAGGVAKWEIGFIMNLESRAEKLRLLQQE